jgi:hypothetical protein
VLQLSYEGKAVEGAVVDLSPLPSWIASGKHYARAAASPHTRAHAVDDSLFILKIRIETLAVS